MTKNFHLETIKRCLELRKEYPLCNNYAFEVCCRGAAELTSRFINKSVFEPKFKAPTLKAISTLVEGIDTLDFSAGSLRSTTATQRNSINEIKNSLELSYFVLDKDGLDMSVNIDADETHAVPGCLVKAMEFVSHYAKSMLRDTSYDIVRIYRAFKTTKSATKGSENDYERAAVIEKNLKKIQIEFSLPVFMDNEITAILAGLTPWLDQCDEQRRKAFESGDW